MTGTRRRYSHAQAYRLAGWLYDRYADEEGLWSDIPFAGRSPATVAKFVRLACEALDAATNPEDASE